MKSKKLIIFPFFLFIVLLVSHHTNLYSQINPVVDTIPNKLAGNTALGTIIGVAVGGATGAIIGHHMDLQAEELKLALPDAHVERVGEGIVIEMNNKILFGFDKSKLTKEAKLSLGKLNSILKKYPDTNIEVQGHTDDDGTIKYNQALSLRRASAVMGNLSENDMATARLSFKGFGETLPKYTNKTAEGHAQNRRVEFLVSANPKMIADAAAASK
jgi:outer membrane protein OmpA-like peptidoglycan-associated protein